MSQENPITTAKSKSQTAPKRTAKRRNEIIDYVKDMVLSGALSPNDRLPTRRDLQERFDSSMVTIQQAIDQLASDGFVVAKGVEGTFVAPNPPHLSEYAVVLLANSPDSPRSLYVQGLVNEFNKLNGQSPKRFRTYYCKERMDPTGDYHQLADAVSRHRVAGLIFVDHPYPFENTSILDKSGIPRVSVMSSANQANFDVAAVGMQSTFMEKALDYYQEKGVRSLAIATNPRTDTWWEELDRESKARHIDIKPYWRLVSHHKFSESIRNLTHMLMRLPDEDKPEGLFIADDNLTEQAVFGLIDSKSDAVERLDVVSHGNFPYEVSTPLDITYIGMDLKDVANTCLTCLDRQAAGEAASAVYEEITPFFK